MKDGLFKKFVVIGMIGVSSLMALTPAMAAKPNMENVQCTDTAKKAEVAGAKVALEQRKIIINTLTNEKSFLPMETSCIDDMLKFNLTLSMGFLSLSNIVTTALTAAINKAVETVCLGIHTWVVNEVTGSINKSIGYAGIPGLDNLGSIYVGFGRYGRVGDSGPDYDPITYKRAKVPQATTGENQAQPEITNSVVDRIKNVF